VATYELGRQPFGLASPAAWLAARGARVRCLDLHVEPFDVGAVAAADLVAFHVPMHTATRLALAWLPRVRRINPRAHLCCYGLYAPVNAEPLRAAGVETILGAEFEAELCALALRLAGADGAEAGIEPAAAPDRPARLTFEVPERSGLPPLAAYARLHVARGDLRVTGYTEASRGCKHACRHCPIVPVYRRSFRVVGRDVVIEDVRRQVAAGARHVTFGDPDFFNGPRHATGIVAALHREFPALTYDVTIKVEHLLRHRDRLAVLSATGCAFVTTAVESFDDHVLERLDKGHTRSDFLRALEYSRQAGPPLQPTFVAFTPWTTRASYREFLATIARLELVDQVAPIQLALRLLIPAGSWLLRLPEVAAIAGAFDAARLVHPWEHADATLDELQRRVLDVAGRAQQEGLDRRRSFARIAAAAGEGEPGGLPWTEELADVPARAAIPFLTEPWYC